MKKILYSLSIIFCLGLTLSSCFGDLDTMPLDESQLVTEKVYSTPEGYTGVLAKCYASLTHIAQLLPSNSLKFNHPIFQEALSDALQILT